MSVPTTIIAAVDRIEASVQRLQWIIAQASIPQQDKPLAGYHEADRWMVGKYET